MIKVIEPAYKMKNGIMDHHTLGKGIKIVESIPKAESGCFQTSATNI